MDEPTADLSRPDLARVCVEIDLTAPKVQTVHLQINGKTYRQQVVYENCPPYCTFCNHLGHDMSACISKHHPGINHTDKEPRPTGNTSSLMRKLGTLEKSLIIEGRERLLLLMTHISLLMLFLTLLKMALKLLLLLTIGGRNAQESNRDSCPSMVPNSLSEETPSKEVGHTKNFFRGETSKQRHPDNQPPKVHLPHQRVKEKRNSPVSNRFQSLEDMESDDILQLIESTGKSTSLAKNSEAGGSKVETQDHRSGENTHQKMILTDSTASHRHKKEQIT
ncbi:UNVERIFIED_CONTAM: hypothetical protein Slati_1435300 [Sesamum latifolium]|uniref:DUF4283 domain-containing protein n=1 Tax=Sesamum latifolium TaxID=2727402 RepID=A0AAW2X3S8_9LAMI